jgi:hypothetical protein
MKIQSAALAFGMMAGACTLRSDTPSTADGSLTTGPGAGAAGSSGSGGASCSDVTACGGDVIGTWTVASSCLEVTGNLDVSGFGLGCTSLPVAGSLTVTGTWTANSDGTYSDNTSTSGNEQITVPAACLNVSGTTTTCDRIGGPLQGLGYASINCTAAMSGGCTCLAVVQQTGGIGLASADPQKSGNYSTSGNVLTVDSTQQSYCVSGNQLTWTPQSTGAITNGSILLQKGTNGVPGGTGGEGTPSISGIAGSPGITSGSAGSPGSASVDAGGTVGPPVSTGTGPGPCDLYAAGNTPCVAAYSTVRLLSSTYAGPLYEVRKGGTRTGQGGTTLAVGVVAGSGFADAAAQDAFCGTDTCTVSTLFDQSGRGNNLTVAPAGCYTGTASEADYESNAKARALTVSGHSVYALYMSPHEGYRNNNGTGIPTGTAAQGVYEVADGKRIGPACCWDFGNASTNNCYGPTGSMNALYFGTGYWGKGAGNGPWFLGDFEAGVWAGGSGASTTTNNNLPASNVDYAFGILKTSTTNNTPQYAIRVGNAQSGTLTTAYDGQAPANWQGKGGIILGIGGDNSNSSLGTFFEGALTAGRPSDDTDAAVLQNVQAVGYGN